MDYGIKRDWDDPGGVEYRRGGPGEPERMPVVNVNYPKYAAELARLKEKYKDQITLKMGMEFGMQTHTIPQYEKLFSAYPFDFIILSVHQVEDKEFWTQDFHSKRSVRLSRKSSGLSSMTERALRSIHRATAMV